MYEWKNIVVSGLYEQGQRYCTTWLTLNVCTEEF
jgi:hypothetical protein